MPSTLQPPHTGNTPDFLAIGHVTRDILPDGSFALGGTVTFAALTAYRLGLVAAIITCADDELMAQLPSRLPAIGLAGHTSPATTTFINTYTEGFRTQYLRARAGEIQIADISTVWQSAPIILFGPLAQEYTPEFVRHFSQLLPRAGCAAGTTTAVSGPPPGRLPQISYPCSMSSSSATTTCSLSPTETAPTPTPSSRNGACECHYLSPPTAGTAQPSSSTASPNHSPPIPPSKSILPAQATFSLPPSSSISTGTVTPAKP